jgi:hypothetical protein
MSEQVQLLESTKGGGGHGHGSGGGGGGGGRRGGGGGGGDPLAALIEATRPSEKLEAALRHQHEKFVKLIIEKKTRSCHSSPPQLQPLACLAFLSLWHINFSLSLSLLTLILLDLTGDGGDCCNDSRNENLTSELEGVRRDSTLALRSLKQQFDQLQLRLVV